MKKTFITILLAIAAGAAMCPDAAASPAPDKKGEEKNDSIHVFASLKDATFKQNLSEGFIIPYDNDGNPLDTIKTVRSVHWNGSEHVETASVMVTVPRTANIIVFDVGSPGYQTETVTWNLNSIGKRETYREMPPIFLTKARRLKDLNVTASKIKFYNKGDTVVYDADAFQLAEGSMLDALVSQLPGAQIDENGRITVNGEFVESLLLNGKDFFKDDHTVLLENIPAYTVKSIEVYKGHTTEEKLNFKDNTAPRHLTMDVKLKKEYNHGWLLNLQAGYGTADRYLGRAFASWFSPTTSVIITGMTNNLNDNRTPGKNDSWTPESMPSGRQSVREIDLGYNHQSADEKVMARGEVSFSGKLTDYSTSRSSTQFLTNTYERSFSDTKTSNFAFNTFHRGSYTTNNRHRLMLSVGGNYSKTDNYGNSLSGTFNSDYSDISRQALEAIYTNGSTEELKAIVNRSINLTEGMLKSGGFNVSPRVSLKLPGSNDRITLWSYLAYITSKRETWKDYNINFGSDPTPAERRRQFSRNSPNYRKMLNAGIEYHPTMDRGYMAIDYEYSFEDKAKDSHMYALERLEDMGIFGVLPENYESTLDPANSYNSTTRVNGHYLTAMYYTYKSFNNRSTLHLELYPKVGIEHHHMDYWRENRSYLVKRTSVILPRVYTTAGLRYQFGQPKDEEARSFNHELRYNLDLETEGPDLLHLVDVVSDADPLNIEEGNPNLKNAFKQNHTISWEYHPYGKPINNRLRFTFDATTNALVRGYVYNTETGVRRFKTYNVNGNHSYSAANTFNWEFGTKKQFSLSSRTEWSLANNADMLGINAETPTKAQVRNTNIGENLRLTYKIGKQSLQVFGSVTNRHTTSEREDFNTIDAQHYKYGINGTFSLPAGFGISTDLSFYKRVGYGVKELDTTDAVWNLRLTYVPKGSKHWVFTADGFDLLHKLSNVNYAVTATGRTVTYTNTLPRYFVFTVQYRLNIPLKK